MQPSGCQIYKNNHQSMARILEVNEDNRSKMEKYMVSAEKHVILTTKEACEYLKVTKPTLLKYIHLRKIRAAKAGKGWRIALSELNRFLGIR